MQSEPDKKIKILEYISVKKNKLEFCRVKGNTTGSHLVGSKKNPYGDLDLFEVDCLDVNDYFDEFDLIIDNQTRFKNTLIYRKIPHKYYVSPCLNYLMSKPITFMRKREIFANRIIDYFNKIKKNIYIKNTENNEYVYDLETEEGIFNAGIG